MTYETADICCRCKAPFSSSLALVTITICFLTAKHSALSLFASAAFCSSSLYMKVTTNI